ncbi:MAG: LpxI family protein, partial [Stellaceae bacterium]
MATRLGVVAGAGDLPKRVVAAASGAGRPVFVIALKEAADPAWLVGTHHAWIRLGELGKGIALCHENDVTEIVLAGGVKRPSLLSLRPDWRA